ncbi:MAG: phage major capsid protein [Rhodanobacteraceae bacterium]|nr:MAG: phage major capsid protein [Rhodanobacteraceae bacterium]
MNTEPNTVAARRAVEDALMQQGLTRSQRREILAHMPKNQEEPEMATESIKPLVDELNATFADFKNRYNAKIEKTDANMARLQQSIDDANTALQARGSSVAGDGAPRGAYAVAEALRASDSLHALQNGNARAAIVPVAGDIRAVLTGDGSNPYKTPPQYQPGIYGIGQRALTLLDVLPRIVVSGAAFMFNQATSGYANAADYQVNQGDAKAQQAFPVTTITANIATVAAIGSATEQVLSDEPQLGQRIAALLNYNVRNKIEGELVNGAGTTGKILGMLHSGVAFTATTGASNIDAISEAVAHLAAIGWTPGVVVMHPNDWHKVRTTKADSAGVYLSGTFDVPAQPNLWGVPVVQTAGLAEGTAIVADTAQLALLDRQAVTVDLGRMGDDFGNNVVRIRAEARVGLATFAASAVQLVTLA